MASTKPTPPKPTPKKAKSKPVPRPEFLIRTVSLTPVEDEALRQLANDASYYIGRTISGAAIVRALIRQAVQQGPPAADALFVLVEKELKDGVRWGKKSGRGSR
jgi:hypothetical protein